MSGPAADGPSAVQRAGPAARALALLAGLALALIALGLTLGTVLSAWAGMAAAALLARRRAQPLTRLAGWTGAFTGAALVTALLVGWAFAASPRPTDPQVRAAFAAREQRARARGPSEVERALERVLPGSTARGRASQAAGTETLLASPAFRWWMAGMGTVLTAAMVGLWAGTLGWGAASVLAFGATGRWPSRGRAAATPPPDDPLAWADAR